MAVNSNEMQDLLNNLTNFQRDIDSIVESCAKELTARFLAKVIKRTPVGVKPEFEGRKTYQIKKQDGRTRLFLTNAAFYYQRSWGSYMGGTLRRGWTSGKSTKAFADGLAIAKSGNLYTFAVTNNTPWADYVEYGHRQEAGRYVPAIGKRLKKSWVQGKFMMTISAEEIQRSAQGILDKKIQKELEKYFGGQ